MSETKDFRAWLAAQENVPADTKTWMMDSYAKLKEARDTGAMTPDGFEVCEGLLRDLAIGYETGTEDQVLASFRIIYDDIQARLHPKTTRKRKHR